MSLPKKNIRSVRFSDEMMELIESQVGSNFTQKFERLVYNAYMLSSEKEKEIQRLDGIIAERRKQLEKYNHELCQLMPFVDNLKNRLKLLNRYFDDFIEGDL